MAMRVLSERVKSGSGEKRGGVGGWGQTGGEGVALVGCNKGAECREDGVRWVQ